ncbi:MAG: ACP S-malonyltransferase [Candidatus Promineifilaceae bacterium]
MATTYLFPGQGSQYVGMGRNAYGESADARLIFEAADDLLGYKLSDLIFNGPEEKLTETQYQQPALFVASMANWQRMLEEEWPTADYAAGHSLGEFTALAAAGAMTFSDGLKLVRKRGELMRQAGEISPGAMAAILALPVDEIETICAQAQQETGKIVQVANDNCPGQTVISGDNAALQRAMELAGEAGARRVVQLPISIAAHSPLMESVAGEFAEAVDAAPLYTPQIPVIGNVSAEPLQSIEDIRSELKAQLTLPVAWTPSMRWLLSAGSNTFIEAGPKDVLLGLLKRIDRQAKRLAFDKAVEK